MHAARRLALGLSAGALLLTGCSLDLATYTIGRYGEVKGVHVHLGCNDTYEVFDRPDAGTFVVVTNGVNEALAAGCGAEAGQPKPARMHRIAELYLSETTERSRCRIVREVELSPLHTEVSYRCARDPGPATSVRRR